jgi:hypothetical protein
MKKLFRVNVEIELVVVAENRRDAEDQAESIVDVEDGGAEVIAHATELHSAAHLPFGWDPDAIPFNSERDRTISDWLAAAAAPTPSSAGGGT